MAPLRVASSLQTAEHVVEGVVVKINKAGPRPEYETTREDGQQPQQVQHLQHPMHMVSCISISAQS